AARSSRQRSPALSGAGGDELTEGATAQSPDSDCWPASGDIVSFRLVHSPRWRYLLGAPFVPVRYSAACFLFSESTSEVSRGLGMGPSGTRAGRGFGPDQGPLDAVAAAFGWLLKGPDPLVVDGRDFAGLAGRAVPLGELRERLLDPTCPAQ